jgi:hypothetical protein
MIDKVLKLNASEFYNHLDCTMKGALKFQFLFLFFIFASITTQLQYEFPFVESRLAFFIQEYGIKILGMVAIF